MTILMTGGDRPLDEPPMVRECDCPAKTCLPEDNVGCYCWRSGFAIRASDFPEDVEPR